jgi:hypothetical protein
MRSPRNRPNLALPLCAAVAALAPATDASADQEVSVYGVANFQGAGECGGNFASHARHVTSAANFRAPFDDLIALGQWDEANTVNNLDARGTYFIDPAKAMPDGDCCEGYQPSDCGCSGHDGQSGKGVDQGDVFFIQTHGGSTHGGANGPAYMGLQMGNEEYDCRPRSHQAWEFGNPASGDLEIAVVEACQSMDKEVWDNGGHYEFTQHASVFSTFNAYHGNVSCSPTRTAEIGDYAEASVHDGVGDNWIDIMYSPSGNDCPVSVVLGHLEADRDAMYTWGGWLDRKDTGAKDASTIYYVGGCDPDGGSQLPNN